MTRRGQWALAVVLSLLVHSVLLAEGWRWQWPFSETDPVLVKPLTIELYSQQVLDSAAAPRLAAAAPPPPAIAVGDATLPVPKKKPRKKLLPPTSPRTTEEAPPTPADAPPADDASPQADEAPPAEDPGDIGRRDKPFADSGDGKDATPPADDTPAAKTDAMSRRFPDHATLTYEVFYGAFLAGNGDIEWSKTPGGYRLDVRLHPVFGPRLGYSSQGSIGPNGLRPSHFEATRGDQVRETADFDWEAKVLTYGRGDKKTAPLEDGAQDVFSVAFQIALKGGKSLNKNVQVTTGKKVYHYPLSVVGDADVDVDRKIPAVLVRSLSDGDTVEFWIAPDYHNFPLRIRMQDSEKTIDMKLIRLKVGNEIRLERPKQDKSHNAN